MLALGIHYLTGYATATDTGSRERAEWPPHPARVFMALVAAHYEGSVSSQDESNLFYERAALEWLETLPPPELKVSENDNRDVVKHFVPVNDTLPSHTESGSDLKKKLPGTANVARSKQERTFPKTRPHDPNVFLIWPEANPDEVQRKSLARLCAKVTRIGHSSSFVQMWLSESGQEPAADLFPVAENIVFNPRRKRTVYHLRTTTTGTLQYLDEQFKGSEIEAFFDFKDRISAAKGKQAKELKDQFQKRFDVPFSGKNTLPPNRGWPNLALTTAYTREQSGTISSDVKPSPFDPNLIVFAKQDGPALGLEATARLTDALRGAILKRCAPEGNAPEWLCGHKPDGSRAEQPHLALLPLAFAGHEHADGHLLGLALAIPRDVASRERARLLHPLLFDTGSDDLPEPSRITLQLGSLGIWTLDQEERTQPRTALRPETWCHASTTWASVTPVVLDHHPKAKTEEARFGEIVRFIAESCERSGLPRPVEIDVDRISWHQGAPSSIPNQSGFPLLVRHKQQFHVWLRFPCPVEGPVCIGAGRYRGYGFFKPFISMQG